MSQPKTKPDDCPHPASAQENRLSQNEVGFTVCNACGKILWVEDVFAQTKRKI